MPSLHTGACKFVVFLKIDIIDGAGLGYVSPGGGNYTGKGPSK